MYQVGSLVAKTQINILTELLNKLTKATNRSNTIT